MLQVRILLLFVASSIVSLLALMVLATFVVPDAFDPSAASGPFNKVGIIINVIALFAALVVALSYRAQSIFGGSLSPLSFNAELTKEKIWLAQYLAVAAIWILYFWFKFASTHFHGVASQLPFKSLLMILAAYCWFSWRAISLKLGGKL